MSDLPDIFLNAEKFFNSVDKLVWADDITWIDATIKTCEEYQVDYEDVMSLGLICPKLRENIEDEAIADGRVDPGARLPL